MVLAVAVPAPEALEQGGGRQPPRVFGARRDPSQEGRRRRGGDHGGTWVPRVVPGRGGRAQAGTRGSGLVAQPELPLGEHGGGVRGAASGAPVLLPGRGPPTSCRPSPPRSANRGKAAASLSSLRPIGSDTNTRGHASLEPPNPGGHAPGLRVTGLQCAAGGRRSAGQSGAARAAEALPEGRRATLASALELEGTVLREGRLTQFVANNLERRIRLSGAPRGEPPAGGGGSSIPAIDPGALQDVVALAGQVAAQVDELLRNVHCGLQALTALSVGCIQTYRDGVESLGEAADLSIRAMYALVARCEELDRAMQPVPALAKRIRDMKGTLERLEGLCK
uniref:BLOC-1 related complex subunit 6 n=1 Tax=Malurus cyaneus samueli TaxID=2593467 RepID=A0A8C5U9C2_9PASS